jgi:hypothetical protein
MLVLGLSEDLDTEIQIADQLLDFVAVRNVGKIDTAADA